MLRKQRFDSASNEETRQPVTIACRYVEFAYAVYAYEVALPTAIELGTRFEFGLGVAAYAVDQVLSLARKPSRPPIPQLSSIFTATSKSVKVLKSPLVPSKSTSTVPSVSDLALRS